MKVRVYIQHMEEYEVTDEIFKTLYDIHSIGFSATGTPEQYELACNRICEIVNKPMFFDANESEQECIIGVYSLDEYGIEVPILQC